MNTAVAQLPVVQIGFLSPLASQLCDSCHCLSLFLALLYLLQHDVRHVLVLMQIVVNLGLYEVSDILVNT